MRAGLPILAIGLSLGPAATAQFVVPGTHSTIQAAIDDAKAGYEILVLPGTYAESLQIIASVHAPDLTVQSAEGPDVTILAPPDEGTEITGDGHALEGFAIDGASVSIGSGQGVTLAGCVLRGGASVVASHLDDLLVSRCSVRDGGSLTLFISAGVIEACRFEASLGLDVAVCGGDIVVRDSVFDGNEDPDFFGGAADVDFCEYRITFERCAFRNNVAALGGGALHLDAAWFDVVDCVFTGNLTDGRGGVVEVESVSFWGESRVTGCVFDGNAAGDEGGALALTMTGDDVVAVAGSRFCDNAPGHIAGPFEDGGGNTGCCDGDVLHDGVVDFGDVLAVLAAWGPCPPDGPCGEDLDGDGVVGFADVLLVLAGWGPCSPLRPSPDEGSGAARGTRAAAGTIAPSGARPTRGP